MPAPSHRSRRAHAMAPRANPIAKRSSGWNAVPTHIKTGGSNATRTRAVGSQPQRPRRVVRRNEIAPAISTNQPIYPIFTVLLMARALIDHALITPNALSQWVPNATRGGNGTVCPMWAIHATPPESKGYSGAVVL